MSQSFHFFVCNCRRLSAQERMTIVPGSLHSCVTRRSVRPLRHDQTYSTRKTDEYKVHGLCSPSFTGPSFPSTRSAAEWLGRTLSAAAISPLITRLDPGALRFGTDHQSDLLLR